MKKLLFLLLFCLLLTLLPSSAFAQQVFFLDELTGQAVSDTIATVYTDSLRLDRANQDASIFRDSANILGTEDGWRIGGVLTVQSASTISPSLTIRNNTDGAGADSLFSITFVAGSPVLTFNASGSEVAAITLVANDSLKFDGGSFYAFDNVLHLGSDLDNVSGIILFIASDNDQGTIRINTSDALIFSGFSGGYTFDTDITANGITLTGGGFAGGAIDAVDYITLRKNPGGAGADSLITLSFSSGDPLLTFNASDGDAGTIAINTSDALVFNGFSGGYTYDAFVAATAGLTVGTTQDANKIDDSTTGAGSTTLYIGNESILVSGDIGSSVQAEDAELAALAGLTSAADALPYFTGSGSASVTTLSSYMRGVLDDGNEATLHATINLEIGTDVLAQQTIGILDNNLVEIDGADIASGEYARFTATGLESRTAAELLTALAVSLNDLDSTSVDSPNVADGELLVYDLTNQWQNQTLAETSIQPLDADLTTLAAPTNWRVFYSDGSAVITELALGASGTYLKSNGASAAPTFATPAGTGTMTSVKENDAAVGGADIVTIDFLGADFNLTENPDTEIQIVIEDTGIDHDATTNFDANEHFLQSAITETGTVATGTWASNITLGTTETIDFVTPTGLTDGQWMGETTTFLAGENLAIYDLCYIKVGDSRAWKVDATNEAEVDAMIVMALAGPTTGNSGLFLVDGYIREDAWTWVAGAIFNSTTSGNISQTAPAATGEQAKIIGQPIHADIMKFSPSKDYYEVP